LVLEKLRTLPYSAIYSNFLYNSIFKFVPVFLIFVKNLKIFKLSNFQDPFFIFKNFFQHSIIAGGKQEGFAEVSRSDVL
jgi:hypothetical protein